MVKSEWESVRKGADYKNMSVLLRGGVIRNNRSHTRAENCNECVTDADMTKLTAIQMPKW